MMIAPLILAAALAGQGYPDMTNWLGARKPAPAEDRPRPARRLADDSPDLALALMGSPCHRCREDGSRRMERLCRRAGRPIPSLRAGLDGRDPEVRMRCMATVRTLWTCRKCDETGHIDGWDYATGWRKICPDCRGTKVAWPR